jgi:short-subunit dehydrogenase
MKPQDRETVLITGASSGIGLELAKCFAAEGSSLVLVARNTAALEELAAELRKENSIEVMVLTADLALPGTPKKVLSELQGRGVQVDVLVNNAGFGAHGHFSELPLQLQLEIIQVNVTALTDLTGLFLPGMLERKRGGVLNVASVAGFVPGPGLAIYYATKAFVVSLTEALAEELAGTPIKVMALCPGPTKTNFGNVAGFKSARRIQMGSMSAKEVAFEGHRAFRHGRTMVISGWRNRILVFLMRFVPRVWLRKIVRRFNGL